MAHFVGRYVFTVFEAKLLVHLQYVLLNDGSILAHSDDLFVAKRGQRFCERAS